MLCILNSDGELTEEGSFRNTEAGLKKQFGSLLSTRIALETGTQSGWISRLLSSFGHEVIVAHARDLHGISRSDRKNDRNDAEKLARYARLDPKLLNPIQHRTAQQRRDLCALRARDAGWIGASEDITGERGARFGKDGRTALTARGRWSSYLRR